MATAPDAGGPGSHAAGRRLPAVLFDLDGTLIDSITLIADSARFAFAEHAGARPTDAEFMALVGMPLRAMIRHWAGDDEGVVEALVARYREHQMANHDRLVRCYDQVVDTVAALRAAGHPIGVVTSKGEALAARGLSHVGLAPLVDLVVGLESCTRHKPDPEPVRTALDRLQVRPEHAMYVGDSPFDMLAGRAAGVTTVAALWGPFGRDALAPAGPDYWLQRMVELPAVVEQVRSRIAG